ncbi:MAG: hypothetical protein GY953_41945, partial [bacterium]|nr:hypothetical protein [bacterium]
RYRRVFTISSRDHLSLESFESFSRFEAPTTVRVSASRPATGNEINLHFVNYDRETSATHSGRPGAAQERPVPVSSVGVDLVLPPGARVRKVEVVTPESPDPVEVTTESAGGRVRFTMPRFLVYSVARVFLAE